MRTGNDGERVEKVVYLRAPALAAGLDKGGVVALFRLQRSIYEVTYQGVPLADALALVDPKGKWV